jgi:hypothetical protein
MGSSSSTVNAEALLTEDSEPILTELGEAMLLEQPESSSSSGTGNIILDNIDLFRQYSLDAELIDLYFDRGVFYRSADLDEDSDGSSPSTGSSSSEHGEFAIEISLRKRSFLEGAIPADLQLFVYDEKFAGSPTPGMVSAEQVEPNLIRVFLTEGRSPNGVDESSFRLSIEHPGYAEYRVEFKFRKRRNYRVTFALSPKIDRNRSNRLGSDYRQYLLSWINQFWSSWDAGTTPPSLTPPFPNSFVPFYPFAHARWRLLDELSTSNSAGFMEALVEPVEFSEGNEGLVSGKNLLGVTPNNWECINRDPGGLYSFEGYAEESYELGGVKFPRTYKDPDVTFDCRSFALIGAKFIKDQISEICPGSTAQIIGIGSHYLVYVKLQGPEPCCKGSFLYEPMDGATYKDEADFCRDDPGFCESFDKPTTLYEPGNENSDGDFGNPNWEDSAEELTRIENVICGCLNGTYDAGSREAQLKQICESGDMQSWIAENLSSPPSGEPNLESPQTVECQKCVSTWKASWDCDGESWELGIIPEIKCVSEQDEPNEIEAWVEVEGKPCEKQYSIVFEEPCGSDLQCLEKLGGSLQDPELPEDEIQGCCGKWCVLDGEGKNTGDCQYGPKENWETEESLGSAGPFVADEKCEDSDCPEDCPEGYRKVTTGAEFLGTLQNFICLPDCNYSPFLCDQTHGEGFCCEENLFNSGNSCQICQKLGTLRFED